MSTSHSVISNLVKFSVLLGRNKHHILKFSKHKSYIKLAAVLHPHDDYTDMSKQYENGLYSAEDDHTGLSLVSVEYQIEGFIGEKEACPIENT